MFKCRRCIYFIESEHLAGTGMCTKSAPPRFISIIERECPLDDVDIEEE